ncbi:hypothetical protein TUM17564_41900 [Citrobacter freundii]|nr:hypothetical protein EGX89_15710 [Citrobacter freundii]GJK72163.1 hypothetical protein TUM17564_41900 [Citrobacter freundii]
MGAAYRAYKSYPYPSPDREGNIKTLPQRISRCRKAASEHIPRSIVHYVTGVGECGQRTCGLKDEGGLWRTL